MAVTSCLSGTHRLSLCPGSGGQDRRHPQARRVEMTGTSGQDQWPAPRFNVTFCDSNGPCASQSWIVTGNSSTDVVRDNLTGLIWAQDTNLPNGGLLWQEALNYAGNSTGCGYTDWRLPDMTELRNLRLFKNRFSCQRAILSSTWRTGTGLQIPTSNTPSRKPGRCGIWGIWAAGWSEQQDD